METTGFSYTSDKRQRYYDYTLLFMVIALIVIGILMISSISAFNASKYNGGNASFYTSRQILYAAVGIAGMVFLSLVDYRVYALETPRYKFPVFLILGYLAIVGMELLVIVIGHSESEYSGATNGAARWIAVAGFKIQPGEFAKLFVIIIAAYAMCKVCARKDRLKPFVFTMAILGVVTVLAMKESMTTGIVLAGIIACLIFVCSRKKLLFAILVAAAVIAGMLAVKIFGSNTEGGFRSRRIYEWQHLTDEENVGQVKQGLYALSSGGLFGKGFGNGVQKLGHIPEVHTDMIFACIVEEMGLVGGAALLILFALLLWRIAIVAINAPDMYGTLICYGVMVHIGMQVCFNVAVVTGTMPSTGVTLPFISYGGSSLLVLCAECGLVLNVSRNIGYRKRMEMQEAGGWTGANRSSDEERKPLAGLLRRGGLRKVKDDRKKVKPASKAVKKAKSRAAETQRRNDRKTLDRTGKPSGSGTGNTAAAKRTETPPKPIEGGYRMDVVLGQPSSGRKNEDE